MDNAKERLARNVQAIVQDPRPFVAGDAAGILRLLQGRAGAPGTIEEWRWMYERDPEGMRSWITTCGDRVIAHCGSLPHRARIDGEDVLFSELTNASADLEATTNQEDHLHVVAQRMLSQTCSPAEDLVVYAFDRQGEWDYWNGKLRFNLVRSQLTLVKECTQTQIARPSEVEILERFDEQALWLFDRCAGEFGAATVRDAAFLNWRFADNPRARYLALGVRSPEGVLSGYAVIRLPNEKGGTSTLRIVDWLVPSDEREVGELLQRAVLATAQELQATRLQLILPDWSAWFRRFQEWDWLVMPSEQVVISRCALPQYDMHQLRESWWYQWADWHLA